MKATNRADRRRAIRDVYRRKSTNAGKRALMIEARKEGWKGKTYKGALKFGQRLDRNARAAARVRTHG